jgi:hypothetical protein
MGKAERIRRQSAREKIAAQQTAARRAERRRQALMAGGSVIAVIAIVVVFIVIKALGKPAEASGAAALSGSVASEITSVPVSTLNTVGQGDALAFNPKPIVPITGGKPLTSGGKPEVLYIGAEYCPYCATERWAMTVALSRFGTFSGLHFIHSDPTDIYPNTPTLTYYQSTYTSKYVTFVPVETLTVSKQALQTPTTAQDALYKQYDSPPYVASSEKGAIPFVDFGNKYLLGGTQYNPQVLHGKTWREIANALRDPSTAIAQGADGAANTFTATICKLTNNQPSSVCAMPVIQKIEGKL